jgi:Domain of unknown function (DUF4178)
VAKKAFNCPSCGAPIEFRSSITLYSVCEYCRSVVMRNDLDVELIGKVAQLQEDSSPFQIGTEGRYESVSFTLIGRIVRGYEDGQWNEWFMLLNDQRRGWLAEAQGELMVFFEVDADGFKANAAPSEWQVGDSVAIERRSFSVSDIKDVSCIGCQGELPHFVPIGEKSRTVDLTAPPNFCATVEIDAAKPQVYAGKYVEFDECHFERLRTVPGW